MINRLPILVFLCLFSGEGFSKNYIVNNVTEFRNALELSAVNGEDDEIILNKGTYKTTSDGLGTFSFSDVESYNLTIKSKEDASDVVLDGDSKDRVFLYNNSKGNNKLIIENMTIKNGKTVDFIESGGDIEDGGGVSSNSSELIIKNCIFYKNTANFSGGAVYSRGNTEVINTVFRENTASAFAGGGLISNGHLIVINTIFDGNKAGQGGALRGGANTYVYNSTFNNNGQSALQVSGHGSLVLVANNIFSNNIGDYTAAVIFNEGTHKLYNNYIDATKIKTNGMVVIKKKNIQPSIVGSVGYINNTFNISSDSPVINKGMDVHSSEFREFLPSTSDDKIIEYISFLSFDKAGNKRLSGDPVDLGAFEYSEIEGNRAPIANTDNITTERSTAITIDVLQNDSDQDGDSLTIESFDAFSKELGNILRSENKLFYTPKDDFIGNDSFSYVINDGKNGTSTGKVLITIKEKNSGNHAPNVKKKGGGSFSILSLFFLLLMVIGVRLARKTA